MSKKKRKKQKWSRETKFAHYAAKCWRELESVLVVEGIRLDRYWNKKVDEVACAVLAKQLYDFADHVTSCLKFTFAKDIPDLRKDES